MIRRCRKKWLTFYIVGQVRLFQDFLSNAEINQVYDGGMEIFSLIDFSKW